LAPFFVFAILLFDENVQHGRSLLKIFGMVDFFLIVLVGGFCLEIIFGVTLL